MPEKLPPYDADAEENVLASLLIDGSAIEKIVDLLSQQDFYSDRDQWIYGTCLALYQRGEAIDQITVAQELNRREKLTECGGTAFLTYLIANCATSLHIEHYAEIVHRLAMTRQLIATGQQIIALGYENNPNVEETIDKARILLDALKPSKSKHLDLSNLRIIKSNPPHYIMTVNSIDLPLSLTELQQWGRFRSKVLAELDFIPMRPKNWDGVINRLLEQSKKMEAPVDTSAEVEIKLSIKQWFDKKQEGTEYSDIQSGCYAIVPYRGKETEWESKDYWAFQPTPLLRWLKRDLGKTITRDNLWAMMTGWGAVKHQWRIGKAKDSMPIRLWALPPEFATKDEYAIEEKQEELPVISEPEELPDF